MDTEISKTNEDLEFFNSRLDEIRMSGHERIKAKAQLARAEAMADFFFAAVGGLGRLVKAVFARAGSPAAPRGTATHAG